MPELDAEHRAELERTILARLEAKSVHEYQWPRWAAANEAADALAPLVAGWLADAWDKAVRECHDLGWLHDYARSDGLERNPYRGGDDG